MAKSMKMSFSLSSRLRLNSFVVCRLFCIFVKLYLTKNYLIAHNRMIVVYDDVLTLQEIENLVFNGAKLEISKNAQDRVTKSYNFLKEFSSDKIIYGINTGFGPMAQYRVSDDHLSQLQYNIIRSHACGAGEALSDECVKAAMIARVGSLIQGYSGIHLSAVMLVVEFINRGIYPFVPKHGSVGASGDLVQLAHIALCLIGEGKVHYKGEWVETSKVMAIEGLKPMGVYIREGLCITNGTSVMTGIGLINLIYAKRLLGWSVKSSAMINEVVSSYSDFMTEELNGAKHHIGQSTIAAAMRKETEGSKLLRDRKIELYSGGHQNTKTFETKIQPFYSLRCVPQILGPIYETINSAEKVLVDELNSACDNPIVDYRTENVYHGGNFHGDYVSLEMDKVKIAMTRVAMLTERQLNYLFHDKINEILPPFVNLGVLGLNYGLQASQFTATSTTAECQTLSMPNYVHSIPNNNDNQDIVSMGTNSALLTKMVIDNCYQVMAIDMMALVQAVDCLKNESYLSPKSRVTYDEVREIVPLFIEDTPKYEEIEKLVNYLINKKVEL